MQPAGGGPANDDLDERMRALEARLPALERTLQLLLASHKELRDRFGELAQRARARLGAAPAAAIARLDQDLDQLRRQLVRQIGALPHRLAVGPGAPRAEDDE
jgi:hypothetical protein